MAIFLWAAAPRPFSLSSPALNRLSSREEQLWYLLTVDKLVVKEKKHPLLAPGLWLGNTSQLPRVDEFRAPEKEIFPLGDPKKSNELNAPALELRGSPLSWALHPASIIALSLALTVCGPHSARVCSKQQAIKGRVALEAQGSGRAVRAWE